MGINFKGKLSSSLLHCCLQHVTLLLWPVVSKTGAQVMKPNTSAINITAKPDCDVFFLPVMFVYIG